VLELKDIVDDHRDSLAKSDTKFAVIDTKLNLVIAIMAFLGASVGGVFVSMLFT
jgi:hypothetical protein